MGQRPAAEAPECQDHELPARDSAMRSSEFVGRQVGQGDDRTFRDVAVAHGQIERVCVRGNQLNAECEAALINQAPGAVERPIIGLARHRLPQPLGH